MNEILQLCAVDESTISQDKNLPPETTSPATVIKSKKRRRTITLEIKPDGSIIVRAPFRAPQEKIRDFIHSKKKWIEKNRVEIQKKTIFSKPKSFLEGEAFPFLGRHYKLKINTSGNKIFLLKDDVFVLHKDCLFKAKKIFLSWYKKRSLDIITQRSGFYSQGMNLYPEKIKITSARRRWGSCTHTNTLNFPWKLICLPLSIIDYVIIHELAHIQEKNHSKKFWHIVSTTMSDYKTRKKWLKEKSGDFNCILT